MSTAINEFKNLQKKFRKLQKDNRELRKRIEALELKNVRLCGMCNNG